MPDAKSSRNGTRYKSQQRQLEAPHILQGSRGHGGHVTIALWGITRNHNRFPQIAKGQRGPGYHLRSATVVYSLSPKAVVSFHQGSPAIQLSFNVDQRKVGFCPPMLHNSSRAVGQNLNRLSLWVGLVQSHLRPCRHAPKPAPLVRL